MEQKVGLGAPNDISVRHYLPHAACYLLETILGLVAAAPKEKAYAALLVPA